MFDKIDKLLSKKKESRVKLKPIDAMDIANIIGENVVSGGVRRSSQICLFDVDDKEIAQAKSNLYKQVDGEWIINEELSHRQMSNNSIFYEEKPDREQLNWHVKQMRFSGEPGFINAEEARRRRDDFEGVNPCFTGDMKLLTNEGYKRFDVLAEEEERINVVNKDGKVTSGNVWSNGVKEIVEVNFANGKTIKCTPDHVFMTVNNKEIEAKDLKGKRVLPYYKSDYRSQELLVTEIEYIGEAEVFDFSEPETHWGVVEGVIVHNCAEILLDSKGVCNLTSLNVMNFVEDGEIKENEMLRAQELSARAGYRMSLINFELPRWGRINKRDRLIGTSLTGWQDMINATNMSHEEEAKLLRKLKQTAQKAAADIAEELGDNEPKLVTTVKPEGTQTQMPTVSSGLHYNHSPYYVRRVRISASDPLARVCEELDYPVKPEVGQNPDNPETLVIEFPVKAPEGRVKGDVGAIEQLETYKRFMENYVDHNASITVHVRDEEWDDVEDWLWENWDSVVGISFLSYSDSFYDLMPYEEITEEEYLERLKAMKEFKPSLVAKYESKELERELDESSCDTGACPVR